MRLYIEAEAPHRWARVTKQGVVKRHGLAETLEDLPVKSRGDEIWAVIPGEEVITSEISIPTRNRRKLLQALPFAMEERLTEDVDDFHFIPIDWKPGRSTIVAVVSKQRVDEWRERFAAAGMRLFGMAADYQLLPLHPQTEMCVADHGDGRISLLRSNNVGATMDEESLELWWSSSENESVSVAVNDSQLGRRLLQLGGGDIKEWAIGNDFIQWLGQRKGGAPLFNLLPRDETERRREHAIPGLRAALVILAVAALARLGVDGYELYLLEMENRRLTEEINTLFLQTFPGEQRVVNARSQFRRKIEELAQGDGAAGEFQQLLAAVAPAMRGPVTLEEVSFRNNAMEIVCAVQNFSDLDRLQSVLSSSGIAVELVGSGSLDDRVTGRFRLNRVQG